MLLRFHEFLSLLELCLQLVYLGDLLGVFLFLCVDFLIKGFQFGVAIFKLASVGLFICLLFCQFVFKGFHFRVVLVAAADCGFRAL